jgi:ATP-binding cassette subfamily B protein
VAAAGIVFEALLLRGVMNIAGELRLVEQRLQALGYFLVFALALLLVEWRVAGGLLRLGRLLEVRLRTAFLSRLPRLNDRYFQSRPSSDMAERSHGLHDLRELPWLAGQLVRTVATLVLTVAAITWLDPASAPLAVAAGLAAVALPFAFRPQLLERDLRVRTHTGALTRFYLDALLGLVPVRAHAAERAVRREHEGLLVEWAHASLQLVRSVVGLEALVALAGFAAAGTLLLAHASRGLEPAGSLLLAYWALQLPILGDELALFVSQYPHYRNRVLRAVEPLGAPVESPPRSATSPPHEPRPSDAHGVAIDLGSVAVRAAGQTILEGLDLRLEPGSHVAIVGASGAGRSSLMGLLLGWHRPAVGSLHVDGEALEGERLDRLRRETAWIDPSIQLWNRSLIENLLYGEGENGGLPLDELVRASDLVDVLPRLEEGLQTRLGGGGGLLSGGEGQRVRVGRAWRRQRARLALLDEPFRGLDRARRRTLLERARRHWSEATLLCITHDLEETRGFDRVLVLEGGRLVEDGNPSTLTGDPRSRYRALLDREREVREALWSDSKWRRLQLRDGQLLEAGSEPPR